MHFFSLLTVHEFVDENEIVLDALLGQSGEIGLKNCDEFAEKLEDERRVDVLLRHGGDPQRSASNVKETRSRDVRHRRAHLLASVNDADAKGVQCASPAREIPGAVRIGFPERGPATSRARSNDAS